MTYALSARKVRKTYGHFPALAGVDLDIAPGTSVTLFGRNGAGKTTFLKIAATLARASSGEVAVAGFDVGSEPEKVRRAIGFLSHNTYVYRDLTSRENLRFFSRLYGLDLSDDELVSRLERVGLGHRLNDPVRSFSRGLLQRVGIARVMLHDPQVLLLDEPYTGLDAHAVGILNDMLDEAVGLGSTVVLTTHDLELGLRAAGAAHIIDRGRIVYSGPAGAPETRAAYLRFVQMGGQP
jgi:heme ABC exporter ATP-binding subunit CcmA